MYYCLALLHVITSVQGAVEATNVVGTIGVVSC